jgi:hypothetical protein
VEVFPREESCNGLVFRRACEVGLVPRLHLPVPTFVRKSSSQRSTTRFACL